MATDVEQLVDTGPTARMSRVAERVTFWGVVSQLAPFVLALTAYLAVFLVMHPDTTGDEPHYLLIAESIAFDGDVDLTNDYASRERTLRVVNVFPLPLTLQAADYKHSGQIRPVHGVGLPAVLAPAVAVAGLTGARIVMVIIAALLADQLFRLLRDLGFRRRYRVLAWSAVVFCLPILPFTNQIYPELPAALLVLIALRIMLAGPPSPAKLALGSTAGSALIWLHVRYIPLSAAVFLGLALAACRADTAPSKAHGPLVGIRAVPAVLRRWARILTRQWRQVTLPLVVPYAVGFGLLMAAFQRWYGTISPKASYAAFSDTTVGSGGWRFLYDYLIGDLFNPVVGWIPYVPVQWLGLAALGCAVVRFRWPAAACIAIAGGYELILASAAPNVGWGLPARYLMIMIPLIAVPLALVIQEIRPARFVFGPLLALSFVFAAAAVNDYQGLYPLGDKPRIFALRTTAAAFPNTHPPRLPTSYVLAPGRYGPQTGAVHGNEVVAKAGRDSPGFLLWGPYVALKGGTYRARFALAVSGVAADEAVATIEAAGTPPPKLFARKVITARDLNRRFPSGVTLRFKTPGSYLTETRVFYDGKGTMLAGPVKVEREGSVGAPPGRYPDWPLVILWVVGTLLAGWLLVRVMRSRPVPERS
jgi:hypothetical protein